MLCLCCFLGEFGDFPDCSYIILIALTFLREGAETWLKKKKTHRELDVARLQMARVGVYWQEQQNISAVSSGTQTTDWDWPDSSQEANHGSLQYNRGP